MHAYGKEIHETINTKAETGAILEALRYCHRLRIANV